MAAFLPFLMTGLSALAGGLGNKEQTQKSTGTSTTNSNSTSNTSQNVDTSTTPTYDPLQLQMRNFLMNQFYNRTNPNSVSGLVDNYIGQGTNNINASASQSEQALSAALAARGLSYSPVAGQALAQGQSNRIGQIIGLRNQAPLLNDQLQQSRLTDFATFLKGLPTGTHTVGSTTGTTTNTGTSTTNQQGTVTTPGNVAAGAFGGAAGMLANLYGQGAFGNPTAKKNLNI